jgi:hypothetical protein
MPPEVMTTIPLLHVPEHLLVLLLRGLLRPDEQKVEDDEDEDDRKHLDERIGRLAATGAGAMSGSERGRKASNVAGSNIAFGPRNRVYGVLLPAQVTPG